MPVRTYAYGTRLLVYCILARSIGIFVFFATACLTPVNSLKVALSEDASDLLIETRLFGQVIRVPFSISAGSEGSSRDLPLRPASRADVVTWRFFPYPKGD